MTRPKEPTTGPPPTLVVLGAGGDLTARLLLPGLAGLVNRRRVSVSLIGSDRGPTGTTIDGGTGSSEAFASEVEASPEAAAPRPYHPLRAGGCNRPKDLDRLLRSCSSGPVILYFALPPAVTEHACRALTGLTVPPDTRLVMEKPFGSDTASADKLNQVLTRLVPEDQIFRVDHYLGMSTVLNIFGLRFTNRVLESILDSTHVASVDILLDERLALEGRAGYYDHAGALVDMLQSHASRLVLSDDGAAEHHRPRDVRDGAAAVLRATRVWGNDPVGSSRRARYTAERVGDRMLPSYVDEEGVDPARRHRDPCGGGGGGEQLAVGRRAVQIARWEGPSETWTNAW